MNTESHDCHLIELPEGANPGLLDYYLFDYLLTRPGDFFWLRQDGQIVAINIFIPGNEGGSIAPIPVVIGQEREGPQGPIWGWDGNELKPTLTPSIYRNRGARNGRNEWHGFLNSGRLVSS